MSGKKRVSVFARLGPAGPTSPDEAVPPSHRRYSSDKHLDKGHHSHPLPPPPHSHPHPGTREDTLRERKPSHQDYEDKKQLHYRDVPPPPPLPPSTSTRHRSHKHYHDDMEHLEYSDKPHRDMGRAEKRPSLSSPLPPQPPPQRKSRDLSDRLSPSGKDILSKPFMSGYEDKPAKLSRGGSGINEGGRGSGGGKGRRSPTEGMASETELIDLGEEGRRKRNRAEKKSKVEGGGGMEEPVRRPPKTHHLPERERKDKLGERERHGWPDKPLPPPPPSVSHTGEGTAMVDTRRPDRGGTGRTEERDGRRKWEEEGAEFREQARKRKREGNLEGSCTPPPPDGGLKRVRTSEQVSKEQQSDSSVFSREEKQTRQTKDSAEMLERKRRFESSTAGSNNELDKEENPVKRARFGDPGSGTRKTSHSEFQSSSTGGSSQRRKAEHHRVRGDEQHTLPAGGGGSNPEMSDSGKAPPAKLDWSCISALSLPRPKPPSTSAVQRFSPGAVFSRIGISRSLAGQSLFDLVSATVAKHLAKEDVALRLETGNGFPGNLLEQPFGDSEFAMTGVSGIRSAKENCRVCVNIGPHRQALLASADFALRRKLGKSSKGLIPPSPSSASWTPEHFSTARDLYNSLGTKASGKPAFRLEPSQVGSLLIPK